MNANTITALDQIGPLEHKLRSLDRVEIFRRGEGPAVVVGYAFGGRELIRREQETLREAHAVAERWMTRAEALKAESRLVH